MCNPFLVGIKFNSIQFSSSLVLYADDILLYKLDYIFISRQADYAQLQLDIMKLLLSALDK